MDIATQLLEIERGLWANDATFYRDHVIEDALLVFPRIGTITKRAAQDAAAQVEAEGRRWPEVRFDRVSTLRIAYGVHLLAYEVTSPLEQPGSGLARLASSVYVVRSERWQLAFHQQTPCHGADEPPAPRDPSSRSFAARPWTLLVPW